MLSAALCLTACREVPKEDKLSREIPGPVTLRDVTFHSAALHRDETYRIMAPRTFPQGQRVHVVYLLHGNGGSYKDWSVSAPLAQYVTRGYIFVMPEGHTSYWMNSATISGDRYEDFVTQDLVAEAERGLPADHDRAVAGISMGGFGAIVLALRHPGLYRMAGALSPPVDVPERQFTVKRPLQSVAIRAIFGPYGSATRAARDPFALARTIEPAKATFLYLGTGKEPLAGPIRRFHGVLNQRHLPHVFETQPGGHEWRQWNLHLAAMFGELERREDRQ